MKFKKTTLPNGLRIITVPVKGSPAVMVMVAVETGSNYESKAQNGLSHFLEHMCFKGTTNRPKASEIAQELDSLGAENNAFTSNEWTTYWAKAAKRHFPKLMDIVSDLYLNPTLPEKDLEIERGVILQEISMYEDLPQRKVWEVLDRLLYGDTPAGRPILGPVENIKRLTRDDFVKYRNKHYIASKTIVIVAGDVKETNVLERVGRKFKNVPSGTKVGKDLVKEKQKSPAILVEHKKTDQTHMILATRTFHAKDKRIPALEVLTEILGQGMSSRLFCKLRDEMGACYYVRALSYQYTDHGAFAISTGINNKRAEEVLKVLISECKKLTRTLISEAELEKAKEHKIGHLYMDLETTDSLARFYGDQEITVGRSKTPQQVEKEIRKVSARDVMKVAQDIFKDRNLNLAIVGDIKDTTKLRKALSLR